MIKEQYIKNIDNDTFPEEVQNILSSKNIAIIGCGGQGGYIIDFLARLGVNSISFWDGDNYETTNLNRQIGCVQSTLGQNKAEVMLQYVQKIDQKIKAIRYNWFFGDDKNDLQHLLEHDIVLMAADCYYNPEVMYPLLKQVILNNIPIIYCPADILGGKVHIITKQDVNYIDFIKEKSIEQSKNCEMPLCSQPAYKCALIAAEAVNQMVLYFANSRYACVDTTLSIDIYHHKYIQSDKYGIFDF